MRLLVILAISSCSQQLTDQRSKSWRLRSAIAEKASLDAAKKASSKNQKLCQTIGLDWSYRADKKTCYRIQTSRSGDAVCKAHDPTMLAAGDNQSCISTTQSQNVESSCTQRGSVWVFDPAQKLCLQTTGMVTAAELCRDNKFEYMLI
jgi:hypothetical protein